ncbi:MAG: cytochrome-c peroxidase [Candidatus Kapaibacteriota bacterium]
MLISFGIMLLMGFNNEIPSHIPKPKRALPDSKKDSSRIALGRALFYDPILSRDTTISCASCHSQYNGFTHSDHALSHGIEDRIGKRNAPSLVNLAWSDAFMWDGASFSLEAQVLTPLTAHHEMDNSLDTIIYRLKMHDRYPSMFYDAYKDSTITIAHIVKSIASFESQFISFQSRYDSVQKELTVFTDQENTGYALFKQHCNSCHQEPLFTNNAFADNGLSMNKALPDSGRYAITNAMQDMRHFKVPTLRNIVYTFPYMHDGRFSRLRDVLNHYAYNIDTTDLNRDIIKPMYLTSNQITDVMAFLYTLTDKSFLFNPRFGDPMYLQRVKQ